MSTASTSRKQLEAHGHTVHSSRIIQDEPALVERVLKELADEDVQVILFNGGTGISRRDTTFDALDRNLAKTPARIWRNFSDLELRGNRLSGHDVPCNGWCLSREGDHLDSRIARCGSASVGKAHLA